MSKSPMMSGLLITLLLLFSVMSGASTFKALITPVTSDVKAPGEIICRNSLQAEVGISRF